MRDWLASFQVIDAVRNWLAHPLTKGLSADDPRTTERRRQILVGKPFLRRVYLDWYEEICAALPSGSGRVVEIGAGAGFLKEYIADVVSSDILPVSGLDVVLDATALPFRDRSLRAIVMTNVLHHIGTPRAFVSDALRCIRDDGRLICVEPWVSPWAYLVTRSVNHEPFDPAAPLWEFEGKRPLSDSNGALPWIMFERDRERFQRDFPEWEMEITQRGMPFRYVLSGGVSSRISAPGWSFGLVKAIETFLTSRTRRLDMFATIVLTRRNVNGTRPTAS